MYINKMAVCKDAVVWLRLCPARWNGSSAVQSLHVTYLSCRPVGVGIPDRVELKSTIPVETPFDSNLGLLNQQVRMVSLSSFMHYLQ